MSYVNKKIRVFKEAGDVEVHRKRSDGRMKTYSSATDARAWCDSTEDRRQHILELIRQRDGKGLSLGKYIPIEAIIDILLANKNNDIKRLQREIEELKKFIKDHGLLYEEKPVRVVEPTEEPTALKKDEPVEGGTEQVKEKLKQRTSFVDGSRPGEDITDAGKMGGAEAIAGSETGKPEDMAGAGSKTSGPEGITGAGSKTSGPGGITGAGSKTSGPEGMAGAESTVSGKKSETGGPGSLAETGPGTGGPPVAAMGHYEEEEESKGAGLDQKGSRISDAKGSKVSGPGGGAEGAGIDQTKSGTSGAPGDDEGEEVIDKTMYQTQPEDTTSTPLITDSSEYDSEEKPPRYLEEDEKAAKELLEGKSPEEQLRALKQALADTEAFYNAEHELAVRAIQQLENIKDIVDGGEGKIHPTEGPIKPGPPVARTSVIAGEDNADSCKQEIESLEKEITSMKSAASPEADIIQREVQVLKKYCAQLAAIQKENADLKKERDMLKDGLVSSADNALKDKLVKLDEVTKERDRLRARVQQLEQELSGYSNLPQQIDTFKEKAQALDGLRADENNLRERLDRLRGLEEEVKKLRDKVATTAQPAGDTKDRDALLAKIRELEKQLDKCKCDSKEVEILKVERNCLKMRVDDLSRLQHDYEDLLKKTQGFDALKAECAMYKSKYEELASLEAECNELRSKAQRVEELENERRLLMKEIEDCECCMNGQEDEIKRLTCHLDCLTQDLDKRQDDMKVKVLTMRSHIERKDCLIAKSEQKLADVQDQLRSSIEQLSCETTCLRNRIDELEAEVESYKKALQAKDENNKSSDASVESKIKSMEDKKQALEEMIKALEEKNKGLIDSLQTEKNNAAKLEDALRKAIKSDEHLKQMLKQAKCAIKCITQKLEKHDIVGIGRLEVERENYLKKIKELEEGMTEQQPCGSDRIAELEEELSKANSTIKNLKDNLDQLQHLAEENETLRKLAGQLQDTAKDQVTKLEDTKENLSRKSQETEEKCDELRQKLIEKGMIINDLENQIVNLKHHLETEKNRSSGTEIEMKQQISKLSATTDDDDALINKLKAQINVLNAEIDRLHFDLENQKRECNETVERLKAKIEQHETDTEAIKKLQDDHDDVSTDAERYKKESELLKEELDKLKNKLAQGDNEIDKLKNELAKKHSELTNKDVIEQDCTALKEELNKLKEELTAKENVEKEADDVKKEMNRLMQDLTGKDAIEKENNDLKDEINRLKQELSAKDALDNENKSLKDELNRLKQDTTVTKKDDENKALRDELNNVKQQLNDEMEKSKQCAASKDNLEKENKDLKNEINKLQQDAVKGDGDLANENKNLNDEINKLKKELASKSDVKDDGKEKAFAKERDDLLNQIASQKKEIAELLNKIKEPTKSEDTTALKELENRSKENEKLRDTIDSLEKQLKDLQKTQIDVPKGSPEIDKVVNDLKQNLEKEEAKSRDLEESLKKCQGDNDSLKNKIAEVEEKLRKCQAANEELQKKIGGQPTIQETGQPTGDGDQRVKDLEAELAKRKQECNDMIASLKEQYDRDIKNLQKQNQAAIDKLQKAQRDAVKKLNRQHEGEMGKLKQELRKRERSLSQQKQLSIKNEQSIKDPSLKEPSVRDPSVKEPSVRDPSVKEPSVRDPSVKDPSVKDPSVKEPSIKEPDEKEPSIKEKQLSIKTFEDVCICGKLPMVIPIGSVSDEQVMPDRRPSSSAAPPYAAIPAPRALSAAPQREARSSPYMSQTMPPAVVLPQPMEVKQPMMGYIEPENEKVTSIKKIVELENRLLAKQEHTKQKINLLQNTVEQFKRELELERQRKNDLNNRYENQSKTVANMRVEMDIVKRENVQDKRRLQQLNSTLQNILGNVPQSTPRSMPHGPSLLTTQPLMPHFHTELTLVKENGNKYKHNCIMKRRSCSCSCKKGDVSSDSFEIDE